MKTRTAPLLRILLLAISMAALPSAPAREAPPASIEAWRGEFHERTRQARDGDTAALEAFIRSSLAREDPDILSSVMRFFIISDAARLGMMDGPPPGDVVAAFRHHGKDVHLEAGTKLALVLRAKGREDLAAEMDSIIQPRFQAFQKRIRGQRHAHDGHRSLWRDLMASPLVYALIAILSAAIAPLIFRIHLRRSPQPSPAAAQPPEAQR